MPPPQYQPHNNGPFHFRFPPNGHPSPPGRNSPQKSPPVASSPPTPLKSPSSPPTTITGEKKISNAGNTFLMHTEDYVVRAPKDVQLKNRWNKMFVDARNSGIYSHNKRLLLTEMKKIDLSCPEEVFLLLEDTLSLNNLRREDAKKVVTSALKLQ